MSLKVIAAVADSGVIGRNGELPWKLSYDLKWFKRVTGSTPVVMGRHTFNSILRSLGKPLPGRENILLTHSKGFIFAHGATVVRSWEAILDRAQKEDMFVIGGAGLFELALRDATELYLTRVHAHVAGDTYFPNWNPGEWRLVSSEKHQKDERNEFDFTFEKHIREKPASI